MSAYHIHIVLEVDYNVTINPLRANDALRHSLAGVNNALRHSPAGGRMMP